MNRTTSGISSKWRGLVPRRPKKRRGQAHLRDGRNFESRVSHLASRTNHFATSVASIGIDPQSNRARFAIRSSRRDDPRNAIFTTEDCYETNPMVERCHVDHPVQPSARILGAVRRLPETGFERSLGLLSGGSAQESP